MSQPADPQSQLHEMMFAFNADTASRRAFVAAVSNAYGSGLALPSDTVDLVSQVLAGTLTVDDAVVALGIDIFDPVIQAQ